MRTARFFVKLQRLSVMVVVQAANVYPMITDMGLALAIPLLLLRRVLQVNAQYQFQFIVGNPLWL